jgi:ribonuclease HI
MTDKKDEWKLYFDGFCSKELGSGARLVLEDSTGKRDKYHKDLGRDLTCNQSEYAALFTRLEIAKGKGITRLSVAGDSQLVCKQVVGDWRVKSKNLLPYHQTIETLKSQFECVIIAHIPRGQNTDAIIQAQDS